MLARKELAPQRVERLAGDLLENRVAIFPRTQRGVEPAHGATIVFHHEPREECAGRAVAIAVADFLHVERAARHLRLVMPVSDIVRDALGEPARFARCIMVILNRVRHLVDDHPEIIRVRGDPRDSDEEPVRRAVRGAFQFLFESERELFRRAEVVGREQMRDLRPPFEHEMRSLLGPRAHFSARLALKDNLHLRSGNGLRGQVLAHRGQRLLRGECGDSERHRHDGLEKFPHSHSLRIRRILGDDGGFDLAGCIWNLMQAILLQLFPRCDLRGKKRVLPFHVIGKGAQIIPAFRGNVPARLADFLDDLIFESHADFKVLRSQSVNDEQAPARGGSRRCRRGEFFPQAR